MRELDTIRYYCVWEASTLLRKHTALQAHCCASTLLHKHTAALMLNQMKNTKKCKQPPSLNALENYYIVNNNWILSQVIATSKAVKNLE